MITKLIHVDFRETIELVWKKYITSTSLPLFLKMVIRPFAFGSCDAIFPFDRFKRMRQFRAARKRRKQKSSHTHTHTHTEFSGCDGINGQRFLHSNIRQLSANFFCWRRIVEVENKNVIVTKWFWWFFNEIAYDPARLHQVFHHHHDGWSHPATPSNDKQNQISPSRDWIYYSTETVQPITFDSFSLISLVVVLN
jgi:hypothetical protein